MDFYNFISFVCISWTVVSLIGFVIHKCKPDIAPTWENGVMKTVTWVFDAFYEGLTGKQPISQVINNALIFTNEEIRKFPKLFDGHPYDTPSFAEYPTIQNGIAWYNLCAVGLISKYCDISNEQIAEIAVHVIQNYFWETRGCRVHIYIKVVSPKRLYFAIPLSEEGKRFLDKQESQKLVQDKVPENPKPLEEEIDLWSD